MRKYKITLGGDRCSELKQNKDREMTKAGPLNWSMILGDTRFNLNLFRYDEKADSPNVFATEMFQINEHDDIRTAHT